MRSQPLRVFSRRKRPNVGVEPHSAAERTRGAYAGKWNSAQAEEVRKLRAERDSFRTDAERFRWLAERTAATGLERWVHPFQFLCEAVDERRKAGATMCD